MKNSDDVFESLGGSFFKYLIDSTDDKNKSAQMRLMLVAMAILAFVGVEAVKVIFRNNFGSKGLSLFRVILSAIAFGVITGVSYTMWMENSSDMREFGSPMSFIMTACFYALLTIFVLVKGIVQKTKKPNDEVHPQYRGDSVLLGFLMKEGWSQAKVQNLGEPLLTLALGIFLSAVNLIWGIPIIFCAISVWLHLIMEAIFGVSQVRDVLAERGYQMSKDAGFTEAKH